MRNASWRLCWRATLHSLAMAEAGARVFVGGCEQAFARAHGVEWFVAALPIEGATDS